jgi:hypothetical protein
MQLGESAGANDNEKPLEMAGSFYELAAERWLFTDRVREKLAAMRRDNLLPVNNKCMLPTAFGSDRASERYSIYFKIKFKMNYFY